jgi:hypothetical protein
MVRMTAVVRRHWPFLTLLAVGTMLRLAVLLAYRPAMLEYGDSVVYLRDAQRLVPGAFHPLGYPLFIAPLVGTGSVVGIPIVQHVVGLVLAVLTYLLATKLGCRRWLATLAAAPVLLDAYQLSVEQFVLSETLAELLLLGTFLLFLWRRGQWQVAALVGVVAAAATLTRTVAIVVVAAVVIGQLLLRTGWRAPVATVVAFVVPLVGYAGWYDAEHGQWQLSGYSGRWLYGKVATFADCKHDHLTGQLAQMCPDTPVSQRPSAVWYQWDPHSPLSTVRLQPGQGREKLGSEFARKVIEAQPLSYAKVLALDLVHYFRPTRTSTRHDVPVQIYWFQHPVDVKRWNVGQAHSRVNSNMGMDAQGFYHPGETTLTAYAPAAQLRDYQRIGFVPGPILLLLVLLGLVVAVLPSRTEHQRVRRVFAPMLVLSGLAMLVVASATVPLDWRYLLPSLALFAPAAALGAETLLQRPWRQAPEDAAEDEAGTAADETVSAAPSPASAPTSP